MIQIGLDSCSLKTLLSFLFQSAIIQDKTDCLYKIWSADIIIIISEASITMANMSWVITVSRDGDDGDGKQLREMSIRRRDKPVLALKGYRTFMYAWKLLCLYLLRQQREDCCGKDMIHYYYLCLLLLNKCSEFC